MSISSKKSGHSVDSSPGLRFFGLNVPYSMGVQVNAKGNIVIFHSVGLLDVKERVAVETWTYYGIFHENKGLYPAIGAN